MHQQDDTDARTLLIPNDSSESRRSSGLNYATLIRRISDTSYAGYSYAGDNGNRTRSSYDSSTVADNAYLHLYKPLRYPVLERVEIIDLLTDEGSDSTVYIKPQRESTVRSICNFFFPSSKKSILGFLSLRPLLTIFSIFQIIVTFFSFELFPLALGGVNWALPSEDDTPPATRIQRLFVYSELFQNHILFFDPSDPILTVRRNYGIIFIRGFFSFMSSIFSLSLIRRYSEGLAFVTALCFGFDLLVTFVFLLVRILNTTSADDWPPSDIKIYIGSSIICVIYSWAFFVILLCYWTEQHRIAVWLARRFPKSYGPAFYASSTEVPVPSLQRESSPDEGSLSTKRESVESRISLPSKRPERRMTQTNIEANTAESIEENTEATVNAQQ